MFGFMDEELRLRKRGKLHQDRQLVKCMTKG
jgi:hypothetical protein